MIYRPVPTPSLIHLLYHELYSSHLPPTAVSQTLHDRVDLWLKHFSQLGAVLVDTGCLAVVKPGVVEHQPDIVNVLPRLLVLARVKLTLYCRQVYWVLNNVKVVLEREGWIKKTVTDQRPKTVQLKYVCSLKLVITVNLPWEMIFIILKVLF